jgi:ParB/RepB/Spo0J family partition protein
MEIKKIKISQLTFTEAALRAHTVEDDNIIELAADILVRGLLNLPTVVATEDGNFIVTDGARRSTALILNLSNKLCADEVTVQVKPSQSDLETLADQFAGNATVLKTTNKDYINGLYTLATEGNMSLAKLAKKVGKSKEYINRLFKTLRLPEEIIDAAEAGSVPVGNLITLSELSGKVSDDELADWVIKAGTEKASDFAILVEDEKETIREARKADRKGQTIEFEAKQKFVGKDKLLIMLNDADQAFTAEGSKANEAVLNTMKVIFGLDEESIAEQKANFEEKMADREAKKVARKAERESKSTEEMTSKLEEAGYTVTLKA